MSDSFSDLTPLLERLVHDAMKKLIQQNSINLLRRFGKFLLAATVSELKAISRIANLHDSPDQGSWKTLRLRVIL